MEIYALTILGPGKCAPFTAIISALSKPISPLFRGGILPETAPAAMKTAIIGSLGALTMY